MKQADAYRSSRYLSVFGFRTAVLLYLHEYAFDMRSLAVINGICLKMVKIYTRHRTRELTMRARDEYSIGRVLNSRRKLPSLRSF